MTNTPGYYTEADCHLPDLQALTMQVTDPASVPHAADVQQNIPVYDTPVLQPMLTDPASRQALMAEWAQVLNAGAGVFVLKQAQPDHTAIDQATAVYTQIIADEKAAGGEGADHFAAAGSNDRVWNSLQKLCLTAPDVFVRYFASPAIDAAAEAWLGPAYQMTAQVNLVHPGGQAQQAHRDYHLGFQTAEVSATYPALVHELSPLMTLQGGIAHGDIPVESGPTKLLPFSQAYKPGYAAWRKPDFRAYFEEAHVQLPLQKGDAIFFSPALFHAAGENKSTDIHRMVNLLQVSSPFGRAMESIDRTAMCLALLEPLQQVRSRLSEEQFSAVIASAAEGYSFPTNLDSDPPVGGLAPVTQAALLRKAVTDQTSLADFTQQLNEQNARRLP